MINCEHSCRGYHEIQVMFAAGVVVMLACSAPPIAAGAPPDTKPPPPLQRRLERKQGGIQRLARMVGRSHQVT